MKVKDLLKCMGKTKISLPSAIHTHENFSEVSHSYFVFLADESQRLHGLIQLGQEVRKDIKKRDKNKNKDKNGNRDFKYTWKILCDCEEDLSFIKEDEFVSIKYLTPLAKFDSKTSSPIYR